jgi:hypothetical protein
MKRRHPVLTLVLLIVASELSGQTRPVIYIESLQGNNPGRADTIGHAKVSRGDTLRCTLVGVYDASHQASTACVVRFGNGPWYTLGLNDSMSAPEESEAYLECAGDKPRRCRVKVTAKPIAIDRPPN